jgi:hypothetical protein
MEFPIQISGKSLKYIRNKTGLRIDLCKTPWAILHQSEEVLLL